MLTVQFLPRNERLRTLRDIRAPLKPDAALVVAHHSYSNGDDPAAWLERSIAFAAANGADPTESRVSSAKMPEHLPFMSDDQEMDVLAAVRSS